MPTNETLNIRCICKAAPNCDFRSSTRKEMKRHVIGVHGVNRHKTKHFYVLENPANVAGFWERLGKMFASQREQEKAVANK